MTRVTLPGEKQFTASILILTKESPKKILLLHHRKYNLWIQPGGHIEKFENPIEAAIREAKEETGIDIGFLFKEEPIDELASFLPIPDFFLEEKIQPYREEPGHFHLDMLYKIEIPFQKAQKAEKESLDIGWFGLEEALQLPMYENTKIIVKKILQP